MYVTYEVCECPEKPTEYGKHIFSTPIFEQAERGVENAAKRGKHWLIKGIKADGTKVVFL